MNLKYRSLSLITVVALLFYMSCSSSDEPTPFDCATSDLAIQLINSTNPTTCGTNNGSIQVSASGGQGPYQFKLDNAAFSSTSTFANLGGGSFVITVKDSKGCEKQLAAVVLTAPLGPTANASTILPQTNCSNPNGSITANVTGGQSPYKYKLGAGAFVSSSTFANLKAGMYMITVEDNTGCTITINSQVPSNTGVSYETQIKPILQANCIKSTCHDGSSSLPNWSNLSTVQANAQAIKLRTGNGSMPADQVSTGGLPQNLRDLIACWVDDGAKDN